MENVIKKQASRRKYHYIYKTTCIITERFYIGMHSTDNLEDGYVGSGKRLWHSINKHSRENHVCQILEFLPDRESLKAREREIIDQEMLDEELCMNLALGGQGGLLNKEHANKFHEGGARYMKEKWKNPLFKKYMSNVISNQRILEYKNGTRINLNQGHWNGRIHSEQTIQKMKDSKKDHGIGTSNSQYGKCWITNEIESKKIYKGDTIPEGWRLGRKIN